MTSQLRYGDGITWDKEQLKAALYQLENPTPEQIAETETRRHRLYDLFHELVTRPSSINPDYRINS